MNKTLVRGTTAAAAGAAVLMAGAGLAAASDATASGVAAGSPGVISGNAIQIPIAIPINLCGNSINVLVGVLNPAFGNVCINN
ncbi:chaplin [Streptomyces sp. NPDC127106]|uniref:chaplin n=1 Tax=Streptomyces sp. NPDC127106 TaxID=3345360 RepID=UPI003638D06E